MTGTFITVEGIDGAGKTLAVQAIENEFNVITTQEPSEFWTGKQVRRALQEETASYTEFFLLMADRQYHIEKLINPELDKGNTVVSDRFVDSTFAYQTVQLDGEIQNTNKWMEYVMYPWLIEPDLTIYLNISVDTALERVDREDKFENQKMLEKVKHNYDSLSLANEDRYEIIDGEQSKEEVKEQTLHTVKKHIQ